MRAAARARGLATSDVDELLQDVRVRLWKTGASVERLDGLGAAYVRQVATSAAIDLIRRRRARREEPLRLDATVRDTPAAMRIDPDAELQAASLATAFERALATLARNRALVVQLHLEGYHQQEIARMIGWTEPKVRNLLYRGLDDLRAALHAAGVGPGTRIPHE